MDKLSNLISSRFFDDISSIIATGQHQAYAAAGQAAIATYWNIGRRIVEEEQQGEVRAKYGSKLISELAQRLSTIYGNNYNKRNLQHYRKFYLLFPDFEKVYEFVHNLTWTHIRRLLSVTNEVARKWYLENASRDMWSTATLDRNISSQYFERRLAAQRENPNAALAKAVAPFNDKDPLEYIKNPMVAEFMGFKRDEKYSETQLEQALIDNLEKFIMELGRGFAFVERQQHITTELSDYYVDLVFL